MAEKSLGDLRARANAVLVALENTAAAPAAMTQLAELFVDTIDTLGSIDREYDRFAQSVAEPDGRVVVRLRRLEGLRMDDVRSFNDLDREFKALQLTVGRVDAQVNEHEGRLRSFEETGRPATDPARFSRAAERFSRAALRCEPWSPEVQVAILATLDAVRAALEAGTMREAVGIRAQVDRALVAALTGAVLE